MNEQQLKNYLTELMSKKRDIDKEHTEIVLEAMLRYIGTPDSELRDKLIYSTFYFSVNKGIFNTEQLIDILNTVIGKDFLLHGLGSKENDTVFTRSFSSLVIAVILQHNVSNQFLDEATVRKVQDSLMNYMKNECDVRGYVPDKGWAHSVAHVADAIDELAKQNQLTLDDHIQLLQVVLSKSIYKTTVYQSDESERLVTAAITISRNLDHETILGNIDEIQKLVTSEYRTLPSDLGYNQYINWKQFLTAFYFRLGKLVLFSEIQTSVKENIYELTKTYYRT